MDPSRRGRHIRLDLPQEFGRVGHPEMLDDLAAGDPVHVDRRQRDALPRGGIPWNAPVWVPWNRPTVTTWSPSATMLSFTYRPSGNASYSSARPRRNPARSNRGTPGARPTNPGARRSPWTFRSRSP